MQTKIDYIENEKFHLKELEQKLKKIYTDDSSVMIVELTKKLSDYKMN